MTYTNHERVLNETAARQARRSLVSGEILAQPVVIGDILHPELPETVDSNSWRMGDC